MNFTFVGGTPQQINWVHDAIADTNYPILNALPEVFVTVVWQDPLPSSSDIGHAHSYMVTSGSGGAFTIYIASWADQPGNLNLAGLPDPAQDTYEFYKQSFTHELAHVLHLTLITTDPQRQQVASLFWTQENTGGTGRRYGTLADWSASSWPDNMMEAIAEAFKCSCYTGRLLYGNRTNWNIDVANWSQLDSELTPPDQFTVQWATSPSGGGLVLPPDGDTPLIPPSSPFAANVTLPGGTALMKIDAEVIFPYPPPYFAPHQNGSTFQISWNLKLIAPIPDPETRFPSVVVNGLVDYTGFFAFVTPSYNGTDTPTTRIDGSAPVEISGQLQAVYLAEGQGAEAGQVVVETSAQVNVNGQTFTESGTVLVAPGTVAVPTFAFAAEGYDEATFSGGIGWQPLSFKPLFPYPFIPGGGEMAAGGAARGILHLR